ncbi:MAG: SGNH/GDSL hydrolase family protein [Chloroflexi bacterium]|jgi:hypothetical protein|uniref:SGNH hydrolase-type esterase domain-containing protein n=1 Tax=Candidatus Thermofonsia Clade 3 bacterium TaxID=2364212 RepID=A0A2M8QEU3_9CHLR|nr:SGNH/GDSL hydrolase family protein [Candidatus Roseilinea sp. NK_OTU-006]PJF48272.1 MAG: hypothetical protein CUN48_04435 [Candidatus Thermofonsia Clade 3 bacterium]RMG66261.1 MAG: SGNH/GDSL hydrolase family protein [Chloroflexota bacterium]
MRPGITNRVVAVIALIALSVAGSVGPAHAIDFVCGDAQTPQVMIDIDGAFARRENSWQSPAVGRMLKFQCFAAIARDEANAWVLVNYGYTRAWVSRSAVRFADGMDITQLPLSQEIPPPPPPPRLRLPGVPTISSAAQRRYRDAVQAGRTPGMVAVLGDCNAEHPVFFGRLASGAFDLTPYPELKTTARAFAAAFNRVSVATSGSFNATMAFDPMWADPKQCQSDEGPLACELRLSNASLLLIALGTGDTFTWRDFERHYRAIIEYALGLKVLPLLMTKADALESQQGGAPADYINGVVRKLGAEYGLPVIDFALAARQLPNGGLAAERNASLQLIEPFHVNEVGMDARILLTLQALAQFPRLSPTPQATPQPRKPLSPASTKRPQATARAPATPPPTPPAPKQHLKE